MGVVVDTSALVELERSLDREEPPEFPGDETVAIPDVVWAEALIGVRLADSPARAASRRAHLEALRWRAEIVPFTPEVAENDADMYAELSRLGSLIPQNDVAVAATGRLLGHAVLVGPGDAKHFRRVPGLAVQVVSRSEA